MTAKKKNTKNPVYDFSSYVKRFWLVLALGVISFFSIFLLAAAGVFGPLPDFDAIENPKSNLASEVISMDGVVLGKFYQENRTHAEFYELPQHLVDALIATEDERFMKHSGIDFRRLVTATLFLGKRGGASTITQQLAKNMFHTRPKKLIDRIFQKFKEWVIAIRIERQYTKEEIIVMYFNQFDFLYQAIGINSAASIYFNSTPMELEMHHTALLVGMVKNPDLFNPRKRPELATSRRNVVFGQMLKNKYITREAFDSLKVLPLDIEFTRQSHLEGSATYFREYLRSYLKEWADANPKADGTKYNIYTDGLKIYTTIDSRMQRYAEEATQEHMANLQRVFFKQQANRKMAPFYKINESVAQSLLDQSMRRSERYRAMKRDGKSLNEIKKAFDTPTEMTVFSWNGEIDTVMTPMDSIRYYKHFYNVGMMSVEPQTGFIKAWVGGINYKHFKYDHVKQSRRQVGSTFKPFVYATAIKQKGYSPCFEVADVPTCIEKGMFDLLKDWCPSNSDKKYGDMISLKQGLAQSKNTVTTYLMKQVGPEPVIRLIRDMGITSDVPIQPSIALGSVDLSVYEMVGSYTTFANKGVYTEPIAITRIEDRNGVVLAEFDPLTREVMSEEDAYVITDLLKGVTQGGTGARLRSKGGKYMEDVVTGFPYGFENPIAGKTGTTQNNSDGWFMGMVPNLITGVWTGCEDRAAHFGGIYYGQGATTALPVWALYMRKCYENKDLNISKGDFERPDVPLQIELNCAEYKRAQRIESSNTAPELDY
ncbi:MAG: transglycosylase domain-containing protein [Schleiferiaceae bacterium]|nr:transglycosylase domain-containing protein [Schleiferiaceae bacterium]